MFFNNEQAGSQHSEGQPKTVGEIFEENLRSYSKLADAFRRLKEAKAATQRDDVGDLLFKNIFPNTEDTELKLLTREPGRMAIGAVLYGKLVRDGEDHYTFYENASEKKSMRMRTPRNPHVYVGKFVNVNRKPDGTLYPTFKHPRFTESFSYSDFCIEAATELIMVRGLIEKKSAE